MDLRFLKFITAPLCTLALLSLLFTSGCSNIANPDAKINSFKELPDFAARLNGKLGLKFKYLGKDSLATRAVFSVNDSLMFRLKFSTDGKEEKSITRYFIDSTTNAGTTWSKQIEIRNINEESVDNIFVGKGYIYIVGFDGVDVLKRNDLASLSIKRIEYEKFKNPDAVFYSRQTDLLSIIISGQQLIIKDTTVLTKRILKFDVRVEDVISNYSYYKDTIYFVSGSLYRGKKDLFINKITLDKAEVKCDKLVLKSDSIPLANLEYGESCRLSVDKKGCFALFRAYTNKWLAVVSQDYGRNWKKAVWPFLAREDMSGIAAFNMSDFLLHSSEGTFSTSKDFFSTYTSFSSDWFYSDSINTIGYVAGVNSQSENLFITARRLISQSFSNWQSPKAYFLFQPYEVDPKTFKRLSKYKIDESSDDIKLTVWLDKKAALDKNINIQLWGNNSFNQESCKTIPLRWLNVNGNVFKADKDDSTQYSCTFKADSIGVTEGKAYKLSLKYFDGSFKQEYNLPERKFMPLPLFKRYPWLTGVLYVAAGFAVLYFLFFVLYLVSPYSLYYIYGQVIVLRLIADKLGAVGFIFTLLNDLIFIPVIIKSDRVLDAWVRKNTKVLDYFLENESTVVGHPENNFVPLPISQQTPTGPEIEKPDPISLAYLFKEPRVCIEIIGFGGAGKTTLGLQLARWASDVQNYRYFNNQLWLPLLIEEETDDLFAVIKGKLLSINQKQVDNDFLRALLAKKRLLVIIDALSERSTAMQSYIKTVYRKVSVNALILTSRTKIDIETDGVAFLYPRLLDSVKVYEIIDKALVATKIELFKNEINRAGIFQKVLSVFHFKDTKIPIIPVLIRLLIDRIITIVRKNGGEMDMQQLFEKMPLSVPDIYLSYVTEVNPKNPNNPFSDREVLMYSELIANYSVGDNFIPSDADYNLVMAAIKKIDPVSKGQIIVRLIENGIIVERSYGGSTFLRFQIDPLAECLAAFYKAKQCGTLKEEWQKLYTEIDKAEAHNFRQMLQIIIATNAKKFNWWSTN